MISLDWMMSEAEAVSDGRPGLRFISEAREAARRSANPYDKLYNSRTGLALAYGYDPRNLHAMAAAHGISKPAIHESVIRRIRSGTESYAPVSMPCDFEVAITQGTYANADELESTRLRMCKALSDSIAQTDNRNDPPLAASLSTWIGLRRSTNWVLFWSAALTVAAPWIAGVISAGDGFAGALLQMPEADFAKTVWRQLVPWLAVLWLLVWQSTAYAKRRMRNVANKFWRNVFRRS